MKARAGEAVLLATAIAVVAVLTLAQPQQQRKMVSTYSSYDTGPNGYRALYEVMRREQIVTRRFERPLATLGTFDETLLLAPSDAERYALQPNATIDSDAAAVLVRLVRGGARLVVLGDVLQFAGAAGTPIAAPTAPLARASSAVRVVSGPYTQGVTSVAAPFTRALVLSKRRNARILLEAGGKPIAVVWRLGKGSVIAIASPDVFSNRLLAQRQNARFAYDVLAGEGTLLFDERLHGYASDVPMWSVLPQSVRIAVYLSIAIVMLAVTGAAVRSAPPVALQPPRLRDSSAYIASMAALLRRARAGACAIDCFAREIARRARLRPNAAARPEIAAAMEELSALHALEHPSDAALLKAARITVLLREELA